MATYFGKPPKSPFALPGTYVTPEGKKSYGGGSAWTEKAKQELLKPTKKKGGGGGSSGQSLQEVAAPPETALTPVIEQAKQQTLSEQLKSQQAKPSSEELTKVWIPAAPGSFGLGGHFVYQDIGGRVIGEEVNVEQASTKKVNIPYRNIKENVLGGYNVVNVGMQESYTKPLFKGLESVGIDLTSSEFMAKTIVSPSVIGVGSFGVGGKETKELLGGISAGIFKDIKEQPFKQVILFGAGVGLGAAFKGVDVGLSSIPKVGGFISPIFKGTTFVAGVGMTGLYGYNIYQDVVTSKTPSEVGEKLGVAAKDFALLGGGFAAGEKGFLKVHGWIRTAGRTEIPIENLVPNYVLEGEKSFPYAKNIGKELKLFEESPYNIPIKRVFEYGGKEELIFPSEYVELPFKVPSTAYHVSPFEFWGKEISATAGTSELPGLYTSYAPSVYFSKIEGGSGYSIKNIIKSILQPSGKPSIAGLQPEEFRITGFTTTKPYQVGGEGKYFKFEFGKSIRPGTLDLPGMKTGAEAEAVLRIGAGDYGLISKEFYTTWKGVNIPLDIFKYEKVSKTLPKELSFKSLVGRGSYSLPEVSPTIIAPIYKSFKFGTSITEISYMPSTESYAPKISSYISSYKPSGGSYISSYKPSKDYSGISGISSPIPIPSYFPSSLKQSSYISSYIPTPPPIIIPGLHWMGLGEKLGKGFKTSRKYRYTPNIGSVLAGFKMPKMTKGIKFAELTGILPRPMIRGLSSKRRKTSGSKKKKK